MKLLVITQRVDKNDTNLGFFHRWLEEFSRHCSKVIIISNSVGTVSLPSNIELYSLGKESGSSRIKRLWKYWELFSHHYALSDAVFFHMIPEFVILSAPFLLSLRKNSVLWYVHKSVTKSLMAAERLIDFVASASELSFRYPSKRVIYTGHAIDIDTFMPDLKHQFSKPGLQMISIGRISPVKDLETVIKACEVLKNTWTRTWSLTIVGSPLMPRDGDYFTSLRKLVEDKGLGSYVFFQGARPYGEIPFLYREHDMFISMSTTGSIDKAVLEAMASGLTVITANEAFKSLLPARYFLEKRSPEFLAERIKMLVDENRPNQKLRELVVENHSLEKTIAHIVKILNPTP